jgi:hypothetical protein
MNQDHENDSFLFVLLTWLLAIFLMPFTIALVFIGKPMPLAGFIQAAAFVWGVSLLLGIPALVVGLFAFSLIMRYGAGLLADYLAWFLCIQLVFVLLFLLFCGSLFSIDDALILAWPGGSTLIAMILRFPAYRSLYRLKST